MNEMHPFRRFTARSLKRPRFFLVMGAQRPSVASLVKRHEDFAETFMLFVKHMGKIPAKFAKKPAIRKKWRAVAEIVKRVAAAKR